MPESRRPRPRRAARPAVESIEGRPLLSLGPIAMPVAELSATGTDPVPLIDLGTGSYQGAEGGLYGGGSNDPPGRLAAWAGRAASEIRPLDRLGRPDSRGRVVLLSIGQSTTMLMFSAFQRRLASTPGVSPSLIAVNGSQDAMVLQNWAHQLGPWKVALSQLRQAGVSPRQVQVLWIDLAQIGAWRYGDFASRTAHYADELTRVIRRAERFFPNARLAYISSRIYGGYGPQGVDPEPYAYESAFGVREAIRRQVAGEPALSPDPSRGPARSPVLLWGPYLWSDGPTPSSIGLSWNRGDLAPDGIHPGGTGTAKVADAMLRFFQADPYAAGWFTAR